MIIEDVFHKIVGQDAAKRKLNRFLKSHKETGIVPNMMFVAPKGTGKTFLAQEFRHGLIRREGEDAGRKAKPIVNVNCSTLKSVKQFFNNLILQYVNDKEVTVLFDEASELPRDVSMALLTILQPNPTNKNSFSYDDYTVDFDFSRQTFLFATSEPHKVFHALTDRLERIDLEDYTHAQLAEIIHRNLNDVEFEDGVLEQFVAPVLRGNARAAQKMAANIRMFIGKSKTFFKEEWQELCYELGIRPLGLTPLEIQVLRTLQQHKETSLTRLSAVTGMTKDSLQKDVEMFLQKQDLMQITTSGRALTGKGIEYLKMIDGGAIA